MHKQQSQRATERLYGADVSLTSDLQVELDQPFAREVTAEEQHCCITLQGHNGQLRRALFRVSATLSGDAVSPLTHCYKQHPAA